MNNRISRITVTPPRAKYPTPALSIGGRIKAFVCDRDGNEIREYPWHKNLILDQGLDQMSETLIANLFLYCVVGTGTQVTSRNGTGTITIANGATEIVGTGSDFTADDVGRLLRMTGGADSGFEAKITSVTSATSAEIATATDQLISSGSYDVYYVEQVGLDTETGRSNTYSVGSGQNGTTTVTDTKTLKRTFLFDPAEADIIYSEIGFSHLGDAGDNLNVRIDLTGSEIEVDEGQRLKVAYELDVTVSPATTASGVVNITDGGLMSVNKNASWVIEKFAIAVIDFNGNTDGTSIDLEPSYAGNSGFSSDSGALVPLTGVNARDNNLSLVENAFEDSYVPGSFERVITGLFDLEDANRSDLRSLMIHSGTFAIFTILFNSNQTKDNDHSFNTRWRKSWGRDLS